jgi:hypothetical protein
MEASFPTIGSDASDEQKGVNLIQEKTQTFLITDDSYDR